MKTFGQHKKKCNRSARHNLSLGKDRKITPQRHQDTKKTKGRKMKVEEKMK